MYINSDSKSYDFVVFLVIINLCIDVFTLCSGGVKAADSRNTDKTRELEYLLRFIHIFYTLLIYSVLNSRTTYLTALPLFLNKSSK